MRSVGMDACIMTCVRIYGFLQSSFTALKISCALLIHPPSSPQTLETTDLFTVSKVLPFRLSYSWNHTVHNLFRLASLVAQTLKNLPALQESWVQSLALEDPLEKEMAIHFSILNWRIPWTEEPGSPLGWSRTRLSD